MMCQSQMHAPLMATNSETQGNTHMICLGVCQFHSTLKHALSAHADTGVSMLQLDQLIHFP